MLVHNIYGLEFHRNSGLQMTDAPMMILGRFASFQDFACPA